MQANGDTHTIRSARMNMSKKQVRNLQREVTRKIVFLFDNKNVVLPSPMALPQVDLKIVRAA
jgi:hypothetical protein